MRTEVKYGATNSIYVGGKTTAMEGVILFSVSAKGLSSQIILLKSEYQRTSIELHDVPNICRSFIYI